MKETTLMRLAAAGLVLCALPAAATMPIGPAAKAALAEMEPPERAKTLQFEQSLHLASGTVQIPGGHASLALGEDYYFLPAADAKRVLTDAWGNPPDSVSNVLGMVFPRDRSFYDGTWGAVLTYEDSGHIDDKDAAEQDYDAVLAAMKSGEEESNKAARHAGYAGSVTIGWAQAPIYDAANKTLIWARNIDFDNSIENTLNYDVRKLARTGVLSLNIVDDMRNLSRVRIAAADLGRTVRLDAGSRYTDFNASTDEVAAYGLAGLVAAGAGVAVAKKLGILGIVLIFLKKGFVVVIGAVVAAGVWLKNKLSRREYAVSAEDEANDSVPPADAGDGTISRYDEI